MIKHSNQFPVYSTSDLHPGKESLSCAMCVSLLLAVQTQKDITGSTKQMKVSSELSYLPASCLASYLDLLFSRFAIFLLKEGLCRRLVLIVGQVLHLMFQSINQSAVTQSLTHSINESMNQAYQRVKRSH